MLRKHNKRGFTLIELAFGLAMAAVASAIALPALQGNRQQARRTACKNNLKQIGLALHNYHDSFNCFPPGWISSNHFGWQTMLLPQMEQARLYNDLNFLTAFDTKSPLFQQRINDFRCPMDRGADLAAGLSRSNYAGVMVGTPSNTTGESTHGGGSFGKNSRRNFRDFRDGSSNTVMVGERMSTTKIQRDVPEGKKVAVTDKDIVRGTEGTWVGLNPGELSIVSSPQLGLPNSNTYGAFSSPHAGGAQFMVGDGSVRFISENINPKTFVAICTTSGGETTGDF